MRLRDLTESQIDALQRQCFAEWQAFKHSHPDPDPDHHFPFKVYEKIWSAGAKAVLEPLKEWPKTFIKPPTPEWVEKHKDDPEPEIIGPAS